MGMGDGRWEMGWVGDGRWETGCAAEGFWGKVIVKGVRATTSEGMVSLSVLASNAHGRGDAGL